MKTSNMQLQCKYFNLHCVRKDISNLFDRFLTLSRRAGVSDWFTDVQYVNQQNIEVIALSVLSPDYRRRENTLFIL